MSKSERRIIVEGLGALAVTAFEMGESKSDIQEKLVSQWRLLDSGPGVFAAAAAAIAGFPQPILEDAETTERRRATREALGVTSADDQLLAAIAAREALEELGRSFG